MATGAPHGAPSIESLGLLILIVVNDSQYLNAYSSIVVTLLGMLMIVNVAQFLNASAPILVTLLGIFTGVNNTHNNILLCS